MEQKHTLEENGYYAQVTDQLIENIGYQMIRRNWSMKTLADKADLPYETVKHLMLSLIHISEPTRRTPISYAVFCLKKKKKTTQKKKKNVEKRIPEI